MDVSMVAGGVYPLTIIDQKGTARSEKVIIERDNNDVVQNNKEQCIFALLFL